MSKKIMVAGGTAEFFEHPRDFVTLGAIHEFIQATPREILEICARYLSGLKQPSKRGEFLDSLDRGTWAAREWLSVLRFHPEVKEGLRPAEYHNLVPNVLKFALANLVSGTSITPTLKANYYALGTNATAPAAADVKLGTEVLRQLFTNRFAEANTAYLNVYFPNSAVAGQTFLEAAIFVDGGSSADTGYPLSLVSINQSVAALNTLTANASFSIN